RRAYHGCSRHLSLNALSIPEVGPLLKSSGYHQHTDAGPFVAPACWARHPFRWLLDSATQMLPLPVAYGTSNATLDDLERFKNRLLGCLLGVMFFCVILALLLSTSPQFKPCVHQTVTGSAALADRERVAEAHARCGRCPLMVGIT